MSAGNDKLSEYGFLPPLDGDFEVKLDKLPKVIFTVSPVTDGQRAEYMDTAFKMEEVPDGEKVKWIRISTVAKRNLTIVKRHVSGIVSAETGKDITGGNLPGAISRMDPVHVFKLGEKILYSAFLDGAQLGN